MGDKGATQIEESYLGGCELISKSNLLAVSLLIPNKNNYHMSESDCISVPIFIINQMHFNSLTALATSYLDR